MNRSSEGARPRSSFVCIGILAAGVAFATAARADVVTDWNAHMLKAIANSTVAGNSLATTRITAIVSVAVFDAVNGVDRRYTAVHVRPAAPRGASRRAAAIEAAYTTLVLLFPEQKSELDQQRAASLAGIVDEPGDEASSVSIARGIEWGASVAQAIQDWRATDLTNPPAPFYGDATVIGGWRSLAPMAGLPFATMSPWVIAAPSQFRASLGPPALDSGQYTADFNETKNTGAADGLPQDDPRQEIPWFWNGNTPAYWNRILEQLSPRYDLSLVENARLFALMNLAMADAGIACWDAKRAFVFWRPITAVALAEQDGNPDTTGLANGAPWVPRLATPPHPEYPSGHSTVSGAAASVLADFFGDATPFTVDSVVFGAIHTHSFASFSSALAEVHNARIWAGIHFRSACRDGSALGEAVAAYIAQNAMLPVNGARVGQ